MSSQPSTPQQLLDNAISAMIHVKSVTLNSNLINLYKSTEPGTGRYITIWQNLYSIDVKNHKLNSSLNINEDDSSLISNYKINMYCYDKYSYRQQWLYTIGNSSTGNINGKWQKTPLPDGNWDSQNQLNSLIDLFKSADQVTFVFNQVLNGRSYSVIDFSPSPEALASWITSHEKEGGALA